MHTDKDLSQPDAPMLQAGPAGACVPLARKIPGRCMRASRSRVPAYAPLESSPKHRLTSNPADQIL